MRNLVNYCTSRRACRTASELLHKYNTIAATQFTYHPESVDVMFNWASLKVQCRQDLDGARILINRIVTLEPKLKKHPLVKALAGDEIDDEPDEAFVPPI